MTEAAALTAAVAVEHQVIYGYGVAGAHLSGADRKLALATLNVHLARRDQLTALVTAAGGTPPPGAPAYALPFPVSSPATARALCALLEDGSAGGAWDLTAAAPARTPARTLGVGWLADAASRAAGWRGPAAAPIALPGKP